LIALATADILAKLAHGFADDALTSIILSPEAPLLLAPAMNGKMWLHPATVANVEILRQRGADFIGPEKGMLTHLSQLAGLASREAAPDGHRGQKVCTTEAVF
jgi:phosphopantothenoylcysteine decarboxylase